MRRETQNILLVLLGGALLKISLTGTYLRYVKPSHQWLLITAGAIMVLLAAISIARDLIPTRTPDGPAPDATADSAAPPADSAPAGSAARNGDSTVAVADPTDPATNSGVRIGDSAAPAADSPVRVSDSVAPAADSAVRVSDAPAPAADSDIRVGDSAVPATDSGVRVGDSTVLAAGSGVRGSGFTARVGDSGVRVGDSAIPAAGAGARAADSVVPAGDSALHPADSAVAVAVREAEPAPAGHRHGHSTTSAWLLLLPVLAVFLVAPPSLGADSVQRSASTNRSAAADDGSAIFPPLPAGDVIALPLSDFSARAAWDKGNSLNDRPIRLTGFIVHDSGATYVARLAIGCCAADAFPIKIKLDDTSGLAALPNDTWVEVVAILKPGTATRDNDFVPSATITDAREIPQPEDPYEH